MNLNNLVRENIYIQMGNISLIASGFLLQVIILNFALVSIEEFAYYKLAISLILSFSLLFTSGIPMYAIRMHKNKVISLLEFKGLFYLNFIFAILFSLTLFILLQFIGSSLIEN